MPASTARWSYKAILAAILLTLFSLSLLLILVSFVFGGVSGEEFNPYTFQRRTFYFTEIPFLHWQIWPVSRASSSHNLENTIASSKLVQPAAGVQQDWHLFSFSRSAVPGGTFEAAILKEYLDARTNRYQYYWEEWHNKNSACGAVFWPYVARFAQLKLYVVLPHLFAAAREATNAKELKATLQTLSVKHLLEQARFATELQEHETAVEIYTSLLELEPKHEEAFEGRSEAYRQLNETEKAAQDTAAAKALNADSSPEKETSSGTSADEST